MTPFSQAVREGLTRWCKPGQAALSTREMVQMLDNPTLSPQDVATLSVLRPLSQHTEDLPIPSRLQTSTISSETLDAYDQAAERGGNRFLQRVEEKYRDCVRRVELTPQQLFGPDGPQAGSVRQGSHPNCVLTSTAIGLAHHRPEELRQMLRQTPAGSFEVHFRDGSPPQTVELPPARDVVKNSCAFQSGLWMTVLDQVTGNVGMVFRSRAMKKMTGHGVDGDSLQWTRRSTTRRKLTEATQDRRVVLACRQETELPSPAGLTSGHCYAVLGYQPDTDLISLQDPNGDEPRDVQGQALDGQADGRFEMTVAQFYSTFASIYYEQSS